MVKLVNKKPYEVRVTASCHDEARQLLFKHSKHNENMKYSTFMMYSSMDKIMDFEKKRTQNVLSQFNDMLLDIIDKSGNLDKKDLQNAFYLFSTQFANALVAKEQEVDKMAIIPYLKDKDLDFDRFNDKRIRAQVVTSYETILNTLKIEELIDDKEASDRSYYHKLFDDKGANEK